MVTPDMKRQYRGNVKRELVHFMRLRQKHCLHTAGLHLTALYPKLARKWVYTPEHVQRVKSCRIMEAILLLADIRLLQENFVILGCRRKSGSVALSRCYRS